MTILAAMKRNASYQTVCWTALIAALGLGTASIAQETPSQTRARTATQSLNQGPVDSTLGTRPTAAPPLAVQPRPAPARPAPSGRTLTDILNATGDESVASGADAATAAAPVETARDEPDIQTPALPVTPQEVEVAIADLPAGPPSALPPLPVGYYSRGTVDCNAIWPREGNLAWLSLTSFTIDFGGCEPGQIVQVTDTTWREDQRCMTELGGDAGSFIVEYEALSPTTIGTLSRLETEPTGQDDIWTHCDAEQVPAQARFHPDDTTRPPPEEEEPA